MRRQGWTLVELLVIIAVIALLLSILMPSLSGARRQARLAACASKMRGVHTALVHYAAFNDSRLPPFAFSDYAGDVPLSGHWGGASQSGDPAAFGRLGVRTVNLWALVVRGLISPQHLICPGADGGLADGRASYFEYTCQYSTYCLRVPAGEELFDKAPSLAYRGGELMGIYAQAAGGQDVRVGSDYETVPLVRIDRAYSTAGAVACGDGDYDFAADVVLADAFWRQNYSADASPPPGLTAWPVRAGWCHGQYFNALTGDGAVRAVRDDGTVEANCITPASAPPDDGWHYATYAERVWQFFDSTP